MSRRTPHEGPSRRRRRRGFSLISMIVAIVLLGVGVSALARASGATLTMQTLAQNRTNAIAIARAYLEEVRTRDPWLVESQGATSVDADGQPGGPYTRRLDVVELRQNLVELRVQVDYPRGTQPVQLVTYLFRGNGLSGAP
jgi:type II secretory pathway pseudopilin PulG